MSRDRLHKEPNQIVNGGPTQERGELKFSSMHTAILLRSMIDSYSSDPSTKNAANRTAVSYTMEGSKRQFDFNLPERNEVNELVANFRENPLQAFKAFRFNLVEIVRDKRVPEQYRRQRLERYMQEFIKVVVKMDIAAFPPDGPRDVHYGIPSYIPEGLSDMGSDPAIDKQYRSGREKIRVDKAESYNVAINDIADAIWALRNENLAPDSPEVEFFLTQHIMNTVHNSMPYDHQRYGKPEDPGRTILLHHKVRAEKPASVCRHIAMESQLRWQLLGLNTRLLKCHMNGGPHAANLNEIAGRWFLTDPTNPEADPDSPGDERAYIREIKYSGDASQMWYLDRYSTHRRSDKPESCVYTARNNMYYRVLDNTKNPAGYY